MTNDSSERVNIPPNTHQVQNYPLGIFTNIQDEFPVAQENPLHLNSNKKNGENREIHYEDVSVSR